MEYAFCDLPAAAYPFTVDFYRVTDPDGTESVHHVDVNGPGACHIPALAEKAGCPVWVRMRFASGEVRDGWPENG